MVNFFRWIIGFVRFRFENGFKDGFLNSCYEQQLAVRNICIADECLVAECAAGHYLRLCRVARQHGGRLRIIRKRGIIFPFLKIKNRFGLLAGAVAFAVIVSFLSGFVWHIDVAGNSRITENEIKTFLSDNGLSEGVYWDNIDKDKIENLMMACFDDCAWVHINELGTTARVEVSETRVKPELADTSGAANLKAVQDGVIVKATVYDGWGVAQKGDAVTKGDLLISGVYESELKKGNQFAHARGEYIAQVTEPFELVVSRKQSYKSYTTNSKHKTLAFFGIDIPLTFGRVDSGSADISTHAEYLKINGNNIPVGIVTTSASNYVVADKTLSDRELTALCEKEIERKLKAQFSDCEIVKKKIDINLTADSAQVNGKITCLKNIGEEVPIKIKKTKKK